MNIIFLDIDGPLLPGKMYLYPENHKLNKGGMPLFDPFAVRCFNLWSKYGAAKTVFSTNWGIHKNVEELKDIMAHNGLELDYHTTPVTLKRFNPSRHNEILGWLDDHSKEGDRFLVVDDDQYCAYISEIMADDRCLIKSTGDWLSVDYDNGLTYNQFKEGCNILDIDIDDIKDQEFGIKPLTEEEKLQREKDLEMWKWLV